MPYVYSTLTNSNTYCIYRKTDPKALPIVERSIHIQGGTGVATAHLDTPRGKATQVTDEELELLKQNPVFRMHMEKGFIKIDDKKRKMDSAVSDMTKRDKSSPLTPADFTKDKMPIVSSAIKA